MEKGSQFLAKAVARYTPIWEPARPGHIYMDVTGTERLWGRAKDTASRVRLDIKGSLSLDGKVGVAGNKMVSNIASRVMPSDGVLDVDHGQESSFMAPLRVGLLPVLDTLPFYIAQEKGYFAEAGVEVEVVPVASPIERDQLMQAREIDAMLNEMTSTALFNREGIQVQSLDNDQKRLLIEAAGDAHCSIRSWTITLHQSGIILELGAPRPGNSNILN